MTCLTNLCVHDLHLHVYATIDSATRHVMRFYQWHSCMRLSTYDKTMMNLPRTVSSALERWVDPGSIQMYRPANDASNDLRVKLHSPAPGFVDTGYLLSSLKPLNIMFVVSPNAHVKRDLLVLQLSTVVACWCNVATVLRGVAVSFATQPVTQLIIWNNFMVM